LWWPSENINILERVRREGKGKGEGRREKGEGRREKGEGRREKGEGEGEDEKRRRKREEQKEMTYEGRARSPQLMQAGKLVPKPEFSFFCSSVASGSGSSANMVSLSILKNLEK
jgi:hypothetical protein